VDTDFIPDSIDCTNEIPSELNLGTNASSLDTYDALYFSELFGSQNESHHLKVYALEILLKIHF